MPKTIFIPPTDEGWDPVNEVFIPSQKGFSIVVEHSLVSLSRWEAKWCKPFLAKKEKTLEETLDYFRFMTLTQNVDPAIYTRLPVEVIKEFNDYIESKQTATIISYRQHAPGSGEVITSELIYYWMVANNIPFECQKWHLNRLLTLIEICGIKSNTNPQKMSRADLARRNNELNRARRAAMHSRG